MFSLDGKSVLLVGGRGRLGASFCQTLVESGAYVICADLPGGDTPSHNDQIQHVDIDVTCPESIQKTVSDIAQSRRPIDIFIYSVTAKTPDSYARFTDVSLAGWKKIINIELDGLFLLSQEVGKVMESQASGAMIFISSIYGLVANDHRLYENSNLDSVYGKGEQGVTKAFSPAVYNVVKAGVISLARYLSAYWGEIGIRVNTISPGGIHHPDENEAFVKKYSDRVPLRRKAKLNEIDGALLYLASDAASYVTGHNLVVDGGWTIW